MSVFILFARKIKRCIRYLVLKLFPQPVKDKLVKLNMYLFHFQSRRHMKHYGKEDPETVYYVIRPLSKEAGLMSLYITALENISFALNKGYKPIVDFEVGFCQYYNGNVINGTANPWEWFFKQPTQITKDDLKKKKNVLFSGWDFNNYEQIPSISKSFETLNNHYWKNISAKYVPVLESVKNKAEEKYRALFDGKDTLGVMIRGTDYEAIKPSGHPVQPSIEQICEKINEFCEKYNIDRIFLVTEDYKNYEVLKKKYGDKLFVSDDGFVKGYSGKGYLYEEIKGDSYGRALTYLIRLLLLNRCKYLISGMTCGSVAANIISEKEFEDAYYFDLGFYN